MTIVTIGPASINKNILNGLKKSGASCFRINLSHSSEDLLCDYWNQLNSVDIKPSLDTQGAQARLQLKHNSINLSPDDKLVLGFGSFPECENHDQSALCHQIEILEQLNINDHIRCDFTGLVLNIDEIQLSKNLVICRTLQGGSMTSNRGIDRPGNPFILPALTTFDKYAIKKYASIGDKKIFLSFCSNSSDIDQVKEFCNDIAVIAKVESKQALLSLDEIVKNSDGILVDRGDLSREISIGLVPYAVSVILKKCISLKKPCYVATNVLDSMMLDLHPSRAEISDIWNLLIAGVSDFVLAAEVAIGKHPLESTQTLNYIKDLYYQSRTGFVSMIDTNGLRSSIEDDKIREWM